LCKANKNKKYIKNHLFHKNIIKPFKMYINREYELNVKNPWEAIIAKCQNVTFCKFSNLT